MADNYASGACTLGSFFVRIEQFCGVYSRKACSSSALGFFGDAVGSFPQNENNNLWSQLNNKYRDKMKQSLKTYKFGHLLAEYKYREYRNTERYSPQWTETEKTWRYLTGEIGMLVTRRLLQITEKSMQSASYWKVPVLLCPDLYRLMTASTLQCRLVDESEQQICGMNLQFIYWVTEIKWIIYILRTKVLPPLDESQRR